VLSNGVCSLQEGVNRFTKSAFMTFDADGRVIGQRLCSSVIRSVKRMTYLEAQALIDGDLKAAREHAKTETPHTPDLVHTLKKCDKLAKILRKRRARDGMIVLNLPEVELVFDEDGHVIDAVPEDDAFTHTIIEMFMVEANEALARTFADLHVPILRRVHPEPAHGDIEQLRMFALAAHVTVPDEPSRRDLQQLLEATRNTPAARAIHFAVLRTLAKAFYSPMIIGHFALASSHYAHFTSPIRRYPDLTLHRVMQAYLDHTDNGQSVAGGKKKRDLERKIMADERALDEGALIELGQHCSDTEVESELAERELREFLVLQFLYDKHLGDEFQGVITGMLGSGVFVSIDRFLIEGKVPLHELPSASGRADRWIVDQTTGRASAQRSGAVLAVGDIVTVQIVQVDLAARHLDLAITKLPERSVALDAPAPSFGRGQRSSKRAAGGYSGGSEVRHGPRKDKKHKRGFKQGRRGKRSR
jgi:ribonuclease R